MWQLFKDNFGIACAELLLNSGGPDLLAQKIQGLVIAVQFLSM